MTTRDITRIKRELKAVENQLSRLLGQQHQPDPLSEHFYLGMVGGSGKPVRALNKRREQALDRTIDRATEIVRLTRRRDDLRARIKGIENRPVHEAIEAEATRRIEAAVREAGVGCTVQSPFGPVRVVRINARSATIETASGYREALPWERVGVVEDAAS